MPADLDVELPETESPDPPAVFCSACGVWVYPGDTCRCEKVDRRPEQTL